MPLLLHAMYNYTKQGGLPIRRRPRPSPVEPSAPKMPMVAARALLTIKLADPKAERARVTSSWTVRPVIAISSCLRRLMRYTKESAPEYDLSRAYRLVTAQHNQEHTSITESCHSCSTPYTVTRSRGGYQSDTDRARLPSCCLCQKCP